MRRNARTAGAAVGVLLSLAGCQTVPRMAGSSPTARTAGVGYSYRAGFATQTFDRPEPEVLEAALGAMEDLSMRPAKEPRRTGTETSVAGFAADGRRVRIDLKPSGEETTASVQVGLFGDEPLSRALLDRIGIRLGKLPAEAIPSEVPSEPESNPFVSREGVPDEVMYEGFDEANSGGSTVP